MCCIGNNRSLGFVMIVDGQQTLTDEELRTLEALLARLGGPGADLPWPLFRFVTEVTATTNVDLLVRDPAKGVLLSWRDDPFGTGWHVPGSIIRHREEVTHRIATCALEEFGCPVNASERPVALIQIFDDRGHSVSLCFPAALSGSPSKRVLSENEAPETRRLAMVRKATSQSLSEPPRVSRRAAFAGAG